MALRRHDRNGGRVRMKHKEDEMALREIADRRRQRQRERQGLGQTQDRLGQDRLERDRVVRDRIEQDRLEQAQFRDPQLPAWANDAIRKSQN